MKSSDIERLMGGVKNDTKEAEKKLERYAIIEAEVRKWTQPNQEDFEQLRTSYLALLADFRSLVEFNRMVADRVIELARFSDDMKATNEVRSSLN